MRMISPMKEWIQEQHEISEDTMISADALSDLRTTNNCISTWYVGEKKDIDIKNGVLALASGFRSLEDIKVVFIDDKKLNDAGLEIQESDGNTKIKAFEKLHRDIAFLNSGKLQKLAKIILESIWEANTTDIHKETLIRWLLAALNDKMLEFKSLDKNLRQGFASSINKMIKSKKIDKTDIEEEVWNSIEKQIEDNMKKTTCKFEKECERYKKFHS